MLLTFIKLPYVIKIFALSILEWPFYTGLLYILPFIDTCTPINNFKWCRVAVWVEPVELFPDILTQPKSK